MRFPTDLSESFKLASTMILQPIFNAARHVTHVAAKAARPLALISLMALAACAVRPGQGQLGTGVNFSLNPNNPPPTTISGNALNCGPNSVPPGYVGQGIDGQWIHNDTNGYCHDQVVVHVPPPEYKQATPPTQNQTLTVHNSSVYARAPSDYDRAYAPYAPRPVQQPQPASAVADPYALQ